MGWFPCQCCSPVKPCGNCTGPRPEEYTLTIPSGFTDGACNGCDELAGDYALRHDVVPWEYSGTDTYGSPSSAPRCNPLISGCCWGYFQSGICTHNVPTVFGTLPNVTFDLAIGLRWLLQSGDYIALVYLALTGVYEPSNLAGGYYWQYEYNWGTTKPPCIPASPPIVLAPTVSGQISPFLAVSCNAYPASLSLAV